ncbi:MAG TPA: glucose 1-dehydrogenase [Candidatus Dormibacteraeota bacterium]|nr:glucose 1-dehydrogenase [Candidatus Dormibacteraeota bacterium]
MKLENRVALVTGAARGIGAGIAQVLAENGATVILTDSSEEVTRTAAAIQKQGYIAASYKMDVTNSRQVDEVVSEVLRKYQRIDILVNNAGIYPRCKLTEMSDEFLQKMFDINVFGVFRCTRAILPGMLQRKYGKILNISSVTGPFVADGSGGQTAYASTKSAVWGFTVALALENAQYGINVNCLCPGHIDTPGGQEQTKTDAEFPDRSLGDLGHTVPLGRMGTPADVGKLALFLVSDDAAYVTGTHVVIDGGNIIQETYRGPYFAK